MFPTDVSVLMLHFIYLSTPLEPSIADLPLDHQLLGTGWRMIENAKLQHQTLENVAWTEVTPQILYSHIKRKKKHYQNDICFFDIRRRRWDPWESQHTWKDKHVGRGQQHAQGSIQGSWVWIQGGQLQLSNIMFSWLVLLWKPHGKDFAQNQ